MFWMVSPTSPIPAGASLNPRVSADLGKTETGGDVVYDPSVQGFATYTVTGTTLDFSVKFIGVQGGPDPIGGIVFI